MVLVCHVILQDQLIKGSYDFMGRSPSNYHNVKFGSHNQSGSGVCHMISQDCILKGSFDFMDRSLSW